MSSPLVSVLMTCYNRELFIAEAIESVLSSTFTDFELIIVDDCSTDNTVEILNKYKLIDTRIKVFINKKNLTDYHNRNKAASYASGKYLKYLDSDDLIYPHGLELIVKCMEKFPEAAFGLESFYDRKSPYPILIRPAEIYMEHFFGFGHFHRAPGSAIIRRDIFELEGGFSGKRLIGDTELWLKLSSKYCMVKIHPDLYWARPHLQQEGTMFKTEMVRAGNDILAMYLNSINCPLSVNQLKKVKKKLFKSKVRNIILKYSAI